MPPHIHTMYVDGDEMIRVLRPLRQLRFNRGNAPEAKRKLLIMRQLFESRIQQSQQSRQLSPDSDKNWSSYVHPFQIRALFQEDDEDNVTPSTSKSGRTRRRLPSASSQMLSIAKQCMNGGGGGGGGNGSGGDCGEVGRKDSVLFICKTGSKFDWLTQQGFQVCKPSALVKFLYRTCRTDDCHRTSIEEWIINLESPFV